MAEKKYIPLDEIMNLDTKGVTGNIYDPDKEFVPLETDDEPKSYLDALNDRFSGAADFVSKVPGFLKELPPALRRAALGLEVGEDGVERPKELKYDFPEISDAPISFLKGLGKTNLTALLTSDTNEKIDILNKGYANDPRFGSEGERTVLNDGLGNPMILWEGKPYYLNKPGFSEVDLDSTIAQTFLFLPAAFTKNKKLLSRIASVGAKTGGLELFRQYLTKDGEIDPGELATTVGVGAAAEAVPFGRFTKLIADRVRRNAEKITQLPVYSAIPAEKQITSAVEGQLATGKDTTTMVDKLEVLPKTKGQRTGEQKDLIIEDLMRNTELYGARSQTQLKQFDESQLKIIKNNVDILLDNIGAGRIKAGEGSAVDIGELIAKEIDDTAAQLKNLGKEAYDKAGGMAPTFLSGPGVLGLAQNLKQNATNFMQGGRQVRIDPSRLERMPIVQNNIKYLDRIIKIYSNPKAKSVNFNAIEDFRIRLNSDIKGATPGSPEQLVLQQMKRGLDDYMNEAVENGLLFGDDEAVNLIKNARKSYKAYKDFQIGTGPAKNQMPKIIDGEKSALEVVSIILGGANKLNDKGLGIDIIKRIIKAEGQNGPTSELLKNAILLRTFSDPKGGITRAKIVGNFKDNFVKNKEITKLLFTDREIQGLDLFVKDVAKTLPVEQMKNPSRSGYTAVDAALQRGIIKPILTKLPIIKNVTETVTEVAEGLRGGSAATKVTTQPGDDLESFLNLMFSPIKALPAAATPEGTMERDMKKKPDETSQSSSLNKIMSNLKPDTIQKLQSFT
tara:strand:+ start:1250 stop:3613 length:2364 start_codon:yes stop_codon:yes gene_type:complete